MSDSQSNPPRVAIKFGKTSSSSSKKHAKPSNIRRHRAHALDDGEESGSSGSEGDDRHHGRHEVITDLDWSTANEKDEANNKRRHHNSGCSDKHDRREDRDSRRRDDDTSIKKEDDEGGESKQPVKFGLTINMRKGGKDAAPKGSRDRPRSRSRSNSRSRTKEGRNGKKAPVSLDDEAMDALLGNERPSKRKAPSDDPDRSPEPEDYRSVPIDDFGATLLKSLGWDGTLRGKVKEATPRHANLAGLGMKDAKGAEELTSWNQKVAAGGKRDSRPARLEDHAKEERNKRKRIEDKYGDSYKRERERERERERGRHR
ncbi:hypothetical protein V8F06_001114 [Rhypophila decipiens]